MNYELALKIARRLESVGFHPAAPPVVLVGYSGGGEMAIGTAEILQQLCRVPAGDHRLWCVQWQRRPGNDPGCGHGGGQSGSVAALGQIAYPGRLSCFSCQLESLAANESSASLSD